MTRRGLWLGRVFGIELKLDPSWFIVFILVAWSLAAHYFPMSHPNWSVETYWALGVVTALLFFLSIVAHELGHSLVSQAYGVPVRDITLFIFGGAARMSTEPRRAREEFWMALAGPATSVMLGLLFGLLWRATGGGPDLIHALSGWLAWINIAVAVFNLIPGFPLDGGRVFRALVWGLTGNLSRATRIASSLGRIVAFAFILFGLWQVLAGLWMNGLWIAFIGWFLDSAAVQTTRNLNLRELLTGHTVREVMATDCPQVSPGISLEFGVNEVVLPSGRRYFPVVENERLLGLLTLHRIKGVPRKRWPSTTVGEAMIPREELKTVRPDEDLSVVLDRMGLDDVNQYPVVKDGKLLGIVARDRMLGFFRTLTELGV